MVIEVAVAAVVASRWTGESLEAESVTLPAEWHGMIGRAEGAERPSGNDCGNGGRERDATKTRLARIRDEFVTAGGRTDTHRLRPRRKR
jgi:hypothetical protein